MPPITANATSPSIDSLVIDFDHHRLLDTLVAGMADLLETTAGADDACTYVSSIASRLGACIEKQYKSALGVQSLNREQLVAALIDSNKRAGGEFFVIEEDEDHIVLGNCRCPLGHAVINHPSLCMLTSNIFGVMTANAVGYAAVDLEQTIARGASACRVVLHLKRTELHPDTREYFRDDASAASS